MQLAMSASALTNPTHFQSQIKKEALSALNLKILKKSLYFLIKISANLQKKKAIIQQTLN
jgi:hypothetical protein